MSRIAAPVVLAAVLLIGTACSSDDPSADPTPEPTSSAPATSPSDEPIDEPSDDPTSSVEPATGPLLANKVASVRAPKGWNITPQVVPGQVDAGNYDYTYSVISIAQNPSYDRSLDADGLAQNWFDSSFYPKVPKELPTTELDGLEAYHIAGWVQKNLYLEEFGAQTGGKVLSLAFMFSRAATPQDRQEIVDSVLATFQWL